MSRDFHFPGRSPVIARHGMAATSHPLASLAAIDTLRAGGTAADAAVAACAVLCVVEPHMTGIGGDCFTLIAKPGEPVWGYNGCGRSGAAASTEKLRAQGLTSIAPDSPHAVTVPGAIEAWDTILRTHGRFDLARNLQTAIDYAENGFPVAARVAWDWADLVPKLKKDAGATRHYLFNGAAPKEGDVIRLPALAKTLRAIAANGPRAFYQGEIADDIVATVAAKGSVLTAADIAAHRGDVVTPISTNYRGLDVVEIPPNGQGITALLILNILETFDIKSLDPMSAERYHLMAEAARIAYAVRDQHVSDPQTMQTQVPDLLDKGFARKLARKIDRNRRADLTTLQTPGSDTIYLTVVDRDRTVISFINSLYSGFGVGICTEKTGIMLNNRGACFNLTPGHPNALAPSKRPLHTIIPALGLRDGRCELSLGVMGGHYQSLGHAQMIQNIVDYGMDMQQAIDTPRLFFDGDRTTVERGFPPATREGLTDRGHTLVDVKPPWGGAQTIKIDWDRGVLIGGSESRKDGCALGY